MPFRVPHDYRSLSLMCGNSGRDPTAEEVHSYASWLRRELALAKTYLESVPKQAPVKHPAKAKE